jgi:vancomycin resistance protein VanW
MGKICCFLLCVFLSGCAGPREVSNYSTALAGRDEAQRKNIGLGSEKLDGLILSPGEVFSFNISVGKRLRRTGYRDAPAILNGGVFESPGGGLCQLSSTLYNVALLAGLEIIERHPHLFRVRSVPPGRDAAVLYDTCDLKFRNSFPGAIKITAGISGERLLVKIMAARRPKESVEIAVEKIAGNSSGKRLPEYLYRVWRIRKTSTGALVEKELISEDTYREGGRPR